MGELEHAADLPARVKAEIEQFFLSVTLFTDKQAKVAGRLRKNTFSVQVAFMTTFRRSLTVNEPTL